MEEKVAHARVWGCLWGRAGDHHVLRLGAWVPGWPAGWPGGCSWLPQTSTLNPSRLAWWLLLRQAGRQAGCMPCVRGRGVSNPASPHCPAHCPASPRCPAPCPALPCTHGCPLGACRSQVMEPRRKERALIGTGQWSFPYQYDKASSGSAWLACAVSARWSSVPCRQPAHSPAAHLAPHRAHALLAHACVPLPAWV